MENKLYCVYIITNINNRVLYTGMTGDLIQRIDQHKNKDFEGFTAKYNVTKLVLFEIFHDPMMAIQREKQIKSWSRRKKVALIDASNPEWQDLYETLF